MDHPTPTELSALREVLEARRDALRGKIRAADRARHSALDPTEVGDRGNEALQRRIAGADAAAERCDVDEWLAAIEALERMDEGRYGDCIDCGEAIGLERLRTQPAAPRCKTCQAVHERRAGASTPR